VLPILEALTAFFEGQDVVTAGYTLEGKHLANFSHLSFTAPVCCLFKVGRHRLTLGSINDQRSVQGIPDAHCMSTQLLVFHNLMVNEYLCLVVRS
jgi:hypothetical protein